MDEFAGFGFGSPEDFKQAQFLSIKLHNSWRFDHTTGQWHHWDGKRWAPDKTNKILHEVAKIAHKAIDEATSDAQKKTYFKLLNVAPQKKALEALATFPTYGTDGSDWDQDPYLLGCLNGVVDLRTNTLIADPDPSCNVTKTTGHAFKPCDGPEDFAVRAPVFMEKMVEWTSGDPDMIAYLLQWFGSSLFGFSPEQRFLLMIGIGRNGKGTLKNTVIRAAGEYGQQFDANLYMRSKLGAARSDAARADLIALKGKRITFFSEPEGNKFNEEMLKAHTGGDIITARALYSNNLISWEPTHSITFLTNDAPDVDDLGPSMAARVMVADFRERYDGDKMDRKLQETLNGEAAGVLAILCYMAREWYEEWSATGRGITLPARVVEQTRTFMAKGDPIANFINEYCEIGDDCKVNATVLYKSYLQWHARTGRDGEPVSQVRFAQVMERKGFKKAKKESGMVYFGITTLSAWKLVDREADEEDDE